MSYYYTTSPNYSNYQNQIDINDLISLLTNQNFEQQQQKQIQNYLNTELQKHNQIIKPRVIKKLETEDEFQIQIYKPYGNYNNYEVLIKHIQPHQPIINLEIYSKEDQFKVIFKFNLNYIDINNINWKWYKQNNILVLNIPKKLHFINHQYDDILNHLLDSNSHLLNNGQCFENNDDEVGYYLNNNEQEPQEDEDEAEQDENLDNSLNDHDKLIRDAINSLISQNHQSNGNYKPKQQQQQPPKDLEAKQKAEKQAKEEEEAKQKAIEEAEAKRKAEFEQAKKQAEELQAKQKAEAEAKQKAEAEAKHKAELESQRKAKLEAKKQKQQELLKKKQELSEKRKQFELKQQKDAKLLQDQQLEIDNLLKQHEIESENDIGHDVDDYDQDFTNPAFIKEQQDYLNKLFGYNLGPVLFNNLSGQGQPQQRQQPQSQSKQPPQQQQQQQQEQHIPPQKPQKPINLKPKTQQQQQQQPQSTSSKKPLPKQINKLNLPNIKKSNSPTIEDVEDEESILFRKKFDH
ncbi:hypothetical protein KGF54_005440 [Candida jiufengensis]|uniref:uncharacterized protein n=1 Tax=Candida jiufengensis TaxID=497108 RepID=UPI002225B592|nr:uncharacterized protein KGF54_005440 [Candida jiufengensis]KAI5949563.1 hypothetical protein KGF54_005440 [Candida jiufengensis]